jgi:large subunit ribosomal protein L24
MTHQKRIKLNDTVKVISGGLKGKTGKVVKVDAARNQVFIEKLNVKVRHIAPNRLNPRGGKKDVHVGIDLSNVALVVDEKGATSRVGYKSSDAGKVRFAKTTGKEIK